MTRFSEIAHDIESQYNPDFDLNPTAPPVNYIVLELCETLDARLTALEAKQAKRPMAINLETALDEAQSEVERLTAELDAARAERDNLEFSIGAAAAEVKRLTAERNALGAQLDDLRNVNAELREGNAELRKHYTNKNDLCAALQKQNVTLWDDNARLRKDNERQNELIAVLRSALQAVECFTAPATPK